MVLRMGIWMGTWMGDMDGTRMGRGWAWRWQDDTPARNLHRALICVSSGCNHFPCLFLFVSGGEMSLSQALRDVMPR